MGYNTEEVDEITSWEDIKDPNLDGRVTLFDSAPTRFGNACAALGYLPEEAVEDDDMYAEVEQEMREQDQNVYNHWQAADQFMQDMREEQAFVSSAWGGRIESLYHDDHPVDYVIPEEGCITWSVAFSIIDESDMKDEVHDLLNWLYQEEVATEMTEHHYYPIPLEGDHDVMNDRFESLETDDIVWFDWEAVIPHLADIEQTFNEIKAE
ncbi:ABC transporter substrate-binding protein [Halostagnicola bangensis]